MSWRKRYTSQAALRDDTNAEAGHEIEVGHQINAARLIAQQLIATGVAGDASDEENPVDFEITLAGHANPGHAPVAGELKDWVRVEITQK